MPTYNSTSDINASLSSILLGIIPNMTITAEQFSQTSSAMLECLTISRIAELNATTISTLKLFHRYTLALILSEDKPIYSQSLAYDRVLDVLSAGVLSRYQIRPFKLYFSKLIFLHHLQQILDLSFETSSGMISIAQLMLDELSDLVSKDILLQLSNKEIYKLKLAVNKLSNFFSLSEQNNNERRRLFHLLQDRIKPVIGYDEFILEQKIVAEINPLDSNLEPTQLSFVSNPSLNETDDSQFKGLILSNYHILDLDLSLFQYGFSGRIQFQLSYSDMAFHSDYLFLYQNQPVSISLKITNTYVFDDPDKEGEKYETISEFQGIGKLNDNTNLTLRDALIGSDIDSQNVKFTSKLPIFEFEFYDALQAFWRVHSPVYVDFNKSYLDLFDDNLFFSYWAELDSQNTTILTVLQKQIVIGTQGRSFYDYFIEALTCYGIYLYYDYASLENGKVTYLLHDDLSTLQDDSSDSRKLTSRDLIRVESVRFDIKQPWYRSESVLNLSIDNTQKTAVEDIYLDDESLFASIRSDTTQLIDDSQVYKNFMLNYAAKRQADEWETHTYEVALREVMPFMPFEPSYVPFELDADQWECSISNFSQAVIINGQRIVYKQNEKTEIELRNRLLSTNYEPDASSEKDWFEKISVVEASTGITHFVSIASIWKDSQSIKNDLPSYQSFIPFSAESVVTVGENIDDNMQKAYTFFTGQEQTAEGSFLSDSSSQSDTYCHSLQSENILTYAVMLPDALYSTTDNQAPIYVPVSLLNATSNGFNPLRNGDYVKVYFENAERVKLESILIKDPIGLDKASEKMTQAAVFGPQEESQFIYTQDAEDQLLQLLQKGSEEQTGNALVFSQTNGIVMTFSDEKESE